MKTRFRHPLLLVAAPLLAAGSLLLAREAAACPEGFHCPPGKTCHLGPGGGCVPNQEPPPPPKEPSPPPKAPPPPEEETRREPEKKKKRRPRVDPTRATERTRERLEEMTEPESPIPPPPGLSVEVPPPPPPPGGGIIVQPPPEEFIEEISRETKRQKCQAEVTGGWLEPVQGVWQDDYTFNDKSGKQIRKVRSKPPVWHAELNMVKYRKTLLFGVRGSLDPFADRKRDKIAILVRANGSRAVPVKMKITLFKSKGGGSPGSGEEIFKSKVLGTVNLDPPCGAWRANFIKLPAKNGIPPKGTFKIGSDSYRIEAELIRAKNDQPTGLKVAVYGDAHSTHGPKVYVVPVLLWDLERFFPDAKKDAFARELGDIGKRLRRKAQEARANIDSIRKSLQQKAKALAASAEKFIPDYFPLIPGSLRVSPQEIRDLSHFVRKRERALRERRLVMSARVFPTKDEIMADLTDHFGAEGFLTGAGRIVVLLQDHDYNSLKGEWHRDPNSAGSAAFAASQKVIFARDSMHHFTLAHELTHTLPYLWSHKSMQRKCDLNYHNTYRGVAHGFRIVLGGAENREVRPYHTPVMGLAMPSGKWIAQCTYWHLLDEFRRPPDPPVVLVRGRLFRKEPGFLGELRSSYQMMGEVDLPQAEGGEWAIVLRDSKGNQLARYPFRPVWEPPHLGRKRRVLSFHYRVADLPNTARIDLVGPSGVLDTKRYSASAPKVRIRSPAPGARLRPADGKVRVAWAGSDPDGDALLYSVLYSPDGGKSWRSEAFEVRASSWEVRPDPQGKDHRVKVLATDGARSAEAAAVFSLAK